ncbi:hypothetical protein WMF39_06605 [Sorangium sp. So ce1504]|uniref:hypothetical protein n=1 Tax=Sorangium sp. So ce1504 TaxID=3133337 RepID=UPI003F5ECD1B
MQAPVGETSEGARTRIVADDDADMRGYLERLLRPLRVIELAFRRDAVLYVNQRVQRGCMVGWPRRGD